MNHRFNLQVRVVHALYNLWSMDMTDAVNSKIISIELMGVAAAQPYTRIPPAPRVL